MFERDLVTSERSHAVNAAALPSPAVPDLIRLATCLQEFSTRRCAAEECCAQLARYLGATAVAVIRLAREPARDHMACCSPATLPGEAQLIAGSRHHADDLTAGGEPMLIGSDLHGDCLLAALLESYHGRHILAVTGSRDRLALETILALVRGAFLARERLDRCYSRLALTGVLLQRAENGLVVIDAQARIVYRNPAAEDPLVAEAGINVRGKRLGLDDGMAQAKLVQFLAALDAPHLPNVVTVQLPRERRQALTLRLVPVLMESPDTLLHPRRGAVIVLHDPERQHTQATEHCRTAFGLTPSENRVLREFCRNPELPAIATALGISPYTVKTHIVHICHKLGVHSRIELQRWLQVHPWPAEPIVIDKFPEFATESWSKST